jgi:hypothetical protein
MIPTITAKLTVSSVATNWFVSIATAAAAAAAATADNINAIAF